MRESFIIYRSFFALIKLLPEKKQVKMFTAIFEYGLDEKEPNFDGEETMRAIWSAIIPQLKANNKRYENGKKGGAPIGNSNAEKQPSSEEINNQRCAKKTTKTIQNKTTKKQPNVNVNVNVNDNVNENVNENENNTRSEQVASEHRKIIPPNLEDVSQYCQERKNGIDPQEFIDFYESKGWVVGKTKMKDWQASIRTWERNHRRDGKINLPKEEKSVTDWINDLAKSAEAMYENNND